MRKGLMIAGLVLLLAGLLFAGQGSGMIRWPESSFMIGRQEWVRHGFAFVAAGVALMLVSRRARR